MESVKYPLMLATVFLVVYVIFTSIEPLLGVAMLMFSLSPLIVIWMVYRVLKDGEASKHTFETHFYEDYKAKND